MSSITVVDYVTGVARSRARKAEPDVVITAQDVQDPELLARMLQDIRRDLAALRRPELRRVYFTRVDTNTANQIRLPHNLGTPVNWWVTANDDNADVLLAENTDSTSKVLILESSGTATVTICIEEAP